MRDLERLLVDLSRSRKVCDQRGNMVDVVEENRELRGPDVVCFACQSGGEMFLFVHLELDSGAVRERVGPGEPDTSTAVEWETPGDIGRVDRNLA